MTLSPFNGSYSFTLSRGMHVYPFQLLGDTLVRFMGQHTRGHTFARFMSQLTRTQPCTIFFVNFVILMGLSDGIERGRECEAVGRVAVRLERKEDDWNPISFER